MCRDVALRSVPVGMQRLHNRLFEKSLYKSPFLLSFRLFYLSLLVVALQRHYIFKNEVEVNYQYNTMKS